MLTYEYRYDVYVADAVRKFIYRNVWSSFEKDCINYMNFANIVYLQHLNYQERNQFVPQDKLARQPHRRPQPETQT